MACGNCGYEALPDARFCAQCGASLERAAIGEGERRHATIVLSDLSGYTALNERFDPEEVEDIMGRVKLAASAAVERNGGIINQFIGDEVVALFGIPLARRDDAARAVRAALELHRAVREISSDVALRIGRELSMHTGVNTGLVIARRSDAREGRYQLTGDTINTAARLLKLAAEGEIVVGQDTLCEISAEFDAEAGQPMEVKGKDKPVVPWRIRGERASGTQAARPFFGRNAEIDRFEALARACTSGRRGRLLVLRGDPGIGKTRLAAELAQRAEALGFETHRALVLDFSAERGGDAVRALARSLERAAPRDVTAPERRIFLAELLDTELEPALRALAAAMPEAVRDRGTRETLCDLARAAAMRQPQFILVEDVHWADAWTLERLGALSELAAHEALVLAITTRRESDPTSRLAASVAADIIDLGPLDVQEMRNLAAQFTDISELTARRLVERAEGNPLFLEQLLLNSGEGSRQELPGSIQGLVLARMDRLPAGDRAALQAASVLGQRFSLEALCWLLDEPLQDCRGLLEHFLLRREGDGFLFWHALIRDGAYAALLRARRRQLHGRAAQWYRERDLALAAEHLELAEDPAAAGTYLAASEQEASRYRYERALELIDRGMALARDDGERHALSSASGRALLDAGRAQEAIAAWQQALALAVDDAGKCQAHIGIAAGLRLLDRAPEGLAALADAEALAGAQGLALERSRLHHLRGNLCFGLGRIDECLREHEAALASALQAGSSEAEANALGGLGDAYYIRGRMRSAHEQFGRCVALARRHGFGRIEVANLHMVGWTAHALNRFREALSVSDECLKLSQAVSHRRVEVIARDLVAYVAGWIIGDVDMGQRHLDIAIPMTQAMGAKRFEGQSRTYHAQLALRRGERSRATALAREALEFCRRHGMEFFGPVALGLVGRLSDDPGERERVNAEALALLDAGAISHCHFEFYAHAIDGALEYSAWEDAEHYCERLQRYTAAEPLDLSEFQVARGRALAAAGRGERSPELAARLNALAAQARTEELNLWLPALEVAYAGISTGSGT